VTKTKAEVLAGAARACREMAVLAQDAFAFLTDGDGVPLLTDAGELRYPEDEQRMFTERLPRWRDAMVDACGVSNAACVQRAWLLSRYHLAAGPELCDFCDEMRACADEIDRMLDACIEAEAAPATLATTSTAPRDRERIEQAVRAALAARGRRTPIVERACVTAFLGDDARGVVPSDSKLDDNEHRAIQRAVTAGILERRQDRPLLVALSAEFRADVERELRST